MTTQQIKDLIASKIAGQGNQVDSGGALSTILDAIVDAVADATKPLVVKMTGDPSDFTVLDNQPTFFEAFDAFTKGQTVIIDIIEEEGGDHTIMEVVSVYENPGNATPYLMVIYGVDDQALEMRSIGPWL